MVCQILLLLILITYFQANKQNKRFEIKMEEKHKGSITHSIKKIGLVTGTILISLGFVLLMKFNIIHELVIKSALDFNPTSESYQAWITNDPPLIVNFYLFNWTNAEECVVHRNCSKFKFEEVGPYPYYEVKEKVNVTWHPNSTISFKFIKRYYGVNDENSTRKVTDLITNVNPVAVVSVNCNLMGSFNFIYNFYILGIGV